MEDNEELTFVDDNQPDNDSSHTLLHKSADDDDVTVSTEEHIDDKENCVVSEIENIEGMEACKTNEDIDVAPNAENKGSANNVIVGAKLKLVENNEAVSSTCEKSNYPKRTRVSHSKQIDSEEPCCSKRTTKPINEEADNNSDDAEIDIFVHGGVVNDGEDYEETESDDADPDYVESENEGESEVDNVSNVSESDLPISKLNEQITKRGRKQVKSTQGRKTCSVSTKKKTNT